ncbi:MAG TPA: mandelate racemase, partial [Planctomycetota bacterium]|nr:mandelate racemase [Planctomycetota bacterium]
MPPALRLREVDLFLRPVRTRLPFRYGKANVTGLPYLHLRARFEPAVVGVSAAALPPLWFDKASPSHEATVADLLRSVRTAVEVYRDLPPATAFVLHRDGEPEARRRLPGFNDLTAGFGVALVDAAVVDAVCRLADRSFHAALRDDLLGFGPLPLPPRPLERIHVRHTVGLADPITPADLREPIGDGLPETLEQVVRAHGVRYFKIKVSGDAPASLERLRAIAAVLDRLAGDYRVTLDGNEQFPNMESAAGFLSRAAEVRSLWARTLWVEQPVERGAALSQRVPDVGKPMLIDESDGTDAAVGRALELGYRGISAKTCKGVFR